MLSTRSFIAFATLFCLGACSGEPTPAPDDAAMPDAGVPDAPQFACEEGPGEVFERQIRPLIESDRPSSCSECHASGITLEAFVTGDACSSMRCLVADGMVDLEAPEQSVVLQLIQRGIDAPSDGPTTDLAQEEYDGFREWIEWSAQCMESACAETLECRSRPNPGSPDMGTADVEEPPPPPALTTENYPCTDEGQLQAFWDHAFPSEARCGHCHSAGGAIAGIGGAPLWVGRHHTMVGALETVRNMYQRELIDLQTPRKSLVLLKPLHPDLGGIDHAGGSKFLSYDDPLYVGLLGWIRLQKKCYREYGPPDAGEFKDEKFRH